MILRCPHCDQRINFGGTVTPEDAATTLGINPKSVKESLRNGSLPIGVAIKLDSGRYRYIVPKAALANFMLYGVTLPVEDRAEMISTCLKMFNAENSKVGMMRAHL